MSQNNQDDLLAELLCVSDSKWVLGHWYAKVILNGRTVPDFSSMAGMSQDELGHTRAMMNYLEQTLDLPEYQLEFGRKVDYISCAYSDVAQAKIAVVSRSEFPDVEQAPLPDWIID